MKTKEIKALWGELCTDFKEIPEVGLCAVHKYMFTYGIVSGLDKISYKGRWCFKTKEEAQTALKYWDGTGDPLGLWVKYKGEEGEYGNIRHPEFNPQFDTPSPHTKKN